MSEYPRVHDCLYSWCPKRCSACDTCDAIARVQYRKAIADLQRMTDKGEIAPLPALLVQA